jgi:NAD-dependent dihydropyrimidine dehydrogenase PreA subunit
VKEATNTTIKTVETIPADKFATGDYYCLLENKTTKKIAANTENSIVLSENEKIPAIGGKIEIQIRLQKPYIDIEKCIGCGICEHECPVSGKRAVRVSAEGETRSSDRRLLLKR